MKNDNDKEIVVMYRQFDGYPTGHGQDLKDFLTGFTVVRGFNRTDGKIANGFDCLAAQIISHFKDGVGGFYLFPAGARDAWEEYIYTVYPNPNNRSEIYLKVEDTYKNGNILYNGAIEDFNPESLEDV